MRGALVALVLHVGCGGRLVRWEPVSDVEATEIRGDVLVRVTGDGGRQLVVVVEQGPFRAAGAATVLPTEVPKRLANREVQHVALARGRAYNALAEQALAAGQPDVAWDAAQRGIEALVLFAQGIKDDSIADISRAEEQRAKDAPAATQRLIDVLRGRLRKYAVSWHDEVL